MKKLTLTAFACGLVAASAATAMENPMVGGAPMLPSRNIVENAVNSADHTTLVAAVQAAELVDALQGDGPFTVFAPVNAAFEALPEGTVETLLMPENRDQLTQILACHVVPANAVAAEIGAMIESGGGRAMAETLGGCTLTLEMAGDALNVIDENGNAATVSIADVIQSNGVIHVIDRVLLPAG